MDRGALILGLVLLAVRAAPAGEPEEPVPTLLAPVYFHHGYAIGRGERPSGLQASTDGGRSWSCVTWPELITSGVEVDSTGRWVYVACGNGVMVSRDAGQSWRLVGGWEITEVQQVCIDRRDPAIAWVASAYGLWRLEHPCQPLEVPAGSAAPARRWVRLGRELEPGYCADVIQDARDPDTLWLATNRGLLRVAAGAPSPAFAPVLQGVAVRRVLQDPARPERLLAATEGRGLQESTDGGQTFARVQGSPDVTFCVTLDAASPGTILAGCPRGVAISLDGGKGWFLSHRGMPEGFLSYAVRVDAGDPGRLLVAGSEGLLESTDRGQSWQPLAFQGALLRDLAATALAGTPPAPPPDTPGALPPWEWSSDEEATGPWPNGEDEAFEARRQAVLEYFRELPPPEGEAWWGWVRGVQEVLEDRADEAFWERVLKELEHPQQSMFFTMPLAGFYLHCRERLPAPVARRIQEVLTRTPCYRGDTENHWVMHYTALLLATQTWPETPASQWYMGRPTRELYAESRGWLRHWTVLTATRGQGEFDSPNYLFMYVTPMLLLYDFASEPAVRRQAGMLLDLLLADYLVESLEGAYCGGHSRIIGTEVELGPANRVSGYHYLYAGGIPRPGKLHGWQLLAALSSYRPPGVLGALASAREEPYVHTEVKRVRNVMRFGATLNPPVHKYTFMTGLYGLGSLQGGILQPIQQHTWDVTWVGSTPQTTCFTVHPSVSARELAMFFPEELQGMTQMISRQKGSYVSPEKLISASPWERTFQEEHLLLALYQVPAGERFQHVTLYAPEALALAEHDGWLVGQDGEFYLAIYPCQEGAWYQGEEHRTRRYDGTRAGFVVLCRPRGEGPLGLRQQSFEEFVAWVGQHGTPVLEGEGETLTLTVRDPGGPERTLVWGQPPPFPAGELYRGPFLQSRVGSGVIRCTAGGRKRVLDLNTLQVTRGTR